MAKPNLSEQLDQWVEQIIANPDARPGVAGIMALNLISRSRLGREQAVRYLVAHGPALIDTACQLRGLPRGEFRARLRNELERRAAMSNETALAKAVEPASTKAIVNPIRVGFRTVTPYLVVANVHEEIAFIEKVFAGEGQIYGLGSAGGFHAEYKIGDSMLMIGGGGAGATWQRTPLPATLHIYVADVDAVYERASRAGATELHPPQDQVYGERSAAFRDVGGNQWYPATYKGDHYIPEGVHNLMPYLHPRGVAKQMDFLKAAFGAEEVVRGESPDGIIYHAQVKIGNSIVEMGEAHHQWQPIPAQFMLYVDDVDAWYARAIQAEGAVSLSLPANQPYGARVGAVKDPFDNTWYLATPTMDS
jgi:PhnB protein